MRSRALHQVLAVLLVAGLVACAPQPEPAEPEPAEPAVDLAAEEQTIRDSSMQWLGAERGHDLLTVMSFMDANVTTIFDGKILSGRAAVEADIQARWDAFPDSEIDWTTSLVDVAASGDLAYERGSWTAGDQSGEFVCIWKRVDGEWKVVVDVASTIKEPDA